MKIELMEKTTKGNGRKYYYVSVDGDALISQTWTDDYKQALLNFAQVKIDYKTWPEDSYNLIKSEEI